MKNFLKKLLLCLVLIPAMVFMFACNTPEPPTGPQTPGDGSSQTGGNGSGEGEGNGNENEGENNGGDENPGTEPVDPVVAAKNAAYAILNNLAKNSLSSLAIDVELDVLKTSKTLDSRYELTNVNMTEEEWDTEVEKKGLFSDFNRATESPYYNGCYSLAICSDGSGYKVEKYGFTLEELEPTSKECVVNHDGKLVYVDNFKSASYVDEEYANFKYLYDFSNNGYNLAEVFATIGNTSSYENLAANLVSKITGVSKHYDPNYDVEVPLDVQVEINILEDSKYELVIKSKYATKYNGSDAVGRNKYEHTSYTNYIFTFNDTSLISIDMTDGEYLFPMTWKYSDLKDILKGESAFALDFDEVFSTNSVVRSWVNNCERINIKFNELNTENFETEESTSKDFDALQKRKFMFYFYPEVDGQIDWSDSTIVTFEYGEELTPPNQYSTEEYDFYFDQAKTKPVEMGTIVPSYGFIEPTYNLLYSTIYVIPKN